MILFSTCKINIGLDILRKRKDGYHDLDTLMVPVREWYDAVELIHSTTPGVTFSGSGLVVDGPADKNLCVKAYHALSGRYPIGGVRMHLHKVIPMGAGLGGGSADASTVLKGLSALFGLHLDTQTLESLAAEIGSDTPFFIANRPALARGRGECLTPFDLSLKGYRLLIVKPDFSISTAEAYAGVTPELPEHSLSERLCAPIASWRETIRNAFEPSLFAKYPQQAHLKEKLYASGALYASMSGSGSALYGIFDPQIPIPTDFGGLLLHSEEMR